MPIDVTVRRGVALALVLAGAAPVLADPFDETAPDYEALSESTKEAIKSACHGWIYEDAANRIAGLADDGVFALCDAEERARRRGDEQPATDASRQTQPRVNHGPDYTPTDFGRRADPDFALRVECDNEYMCNHMRRRAINAGRPVSMAEYNRIAQKCEGEYGCIERAFEKLPEIEVPPAEEPAGPDIAATPDPQGPVSSDATSAAVQRPSAPAPDSPGDLFGASLQLTEWAPGKVTVAVQYSNRAPVHLAIGPVELEMECRDGSRGRAFAGGSAWVAPGESVSLSLSDEGVIHGQSCLGGIESYHTTGRVLYVQAGIGGYVEQVAVCPDGRHLPVVLAMADDAGRRFVFHAEDGESEEVSLADYDARRVLGRLCGGGPLAGAQPEFVGEEIAYLSRGFHTFVKSWSEICAAAPSLCAREYADWTARQPR